MEKGGLIQALQERDVTNQTGLVWSDEMKVGLIGQGRRRSLSSWSEAAPESADGAGMLLVGPGSRL